MMKARNTFSLQCIPVDTTVQTAKLDSDTCADEFSDRLCYNRLLLLLFWFAVFIWIKEEEAALNCEETHVWKGEI